MSMTVLAYCVVGVPIDPDDLYHHETVSVHRDCEGQGNGKYCSACGRARGEQEVLKTPLAGYDPEGGSDYEGSFQDLDIVRVYWGGRARHYLAALCTKDDSAFGKGGPGKLAPFDWDDARDRLRSVLEPVSLWNEEDFGVWSVQYYS